MFLLFSIITLAQEPSTIVKDKIIESIAESMTGDINENSDLSCLVDELEEYFNHPLNINTVTQEELEKFRILNAIQIRNLLNYIKRTGQIYSLFELLLIDGFNKELVEKFSFFITIGPPEVKVPYYRRNEINLRTQYIFEKASGFIANENEEKRFAGIRPKLYLQYKGEIKEQWKWGITTENDAGESFFSGNNKTGFDFYSGHLAWNGKKLLKQLIVGDYQVKTGQGLLFWSGYGGWKSIDGTGLRYSGQGIRPFSSSTEYGFFRGIASSFETDKLNFIVFYSNRNADANITSTNSSGDPTSVSSIQETGYHRTESEIADKGALNIQTAGLSASYTKNRFRAAINGGYQHFNLPLIPDSQLYNRYYFRGKDNFGVSADFQQVFKDGSLFGEAAICQSGGIAFVTGMELSPASEIGLTFLYRDYKKDFHTIAGNPFSEFRTVSNERGFRTGISLFSIPRVNLAAYLDLYESYWIKYSSLSPVNGNDFTIQSDWSVSKQVTLQFRYKYETRNENSSFLTSIKTDANETINRVRINAEYQPSENLRLHFRSEWNNLSKNDSTSQGWFIMADASTAIFHGKITATARIAWFNTDSYNSGIRAYENDLPQSFNFPVYYLNGLRYYLNLHYKVTKNLSFYLKLSQTSILGNTTVIGTDDSQINGNHKSELKFQIRLKF